MFKIVHSRYGKDGDILHWMFNNTLVGSIFFKKLDDQTVLVDKVWAIRGLGLNMYKLGIQWATSTGMLVLLPQRTSCVPCNLIWDKLLTHVESIKLCDGQLGPTIQIEPDSNFSLSKALGNELYERNRQSIRFFHQFTGDGGIDAHQRYSKDASFFIKASM
ncbi:hypothetical protein [Vibrio crassostreae]|uniref:hypothetical protein n=1 Tax=Vibrio crassostreae TaxID=246167 RepID=UPI001B30E6AA|nr:hypothetical protein [Vibrio crassostreae]